MGEAQFPLFAANLRAPDGNPLPKFKDRSILELDGVRIGLTGAAYDGSPQVSNPQDLVFHPTVATIARQAEALRREGADLVVAVVHATREQVYEIFAARQVDLLLSGHTHDLFVEFDGRNAIAESSHDARYVVVIDVAIETAQLNGQRSVHWWPQFRIIDTAAVTPDPQVATVVAKYEEELSKALDVPIGTTAVELDSRVAAVRTGETAFGDLIADAMRTVAKADAALMNAGGIRGGKIYAPGATITRRDVVAELPFHNNLVTIEVRGADLRRAIENGLSRWPSASGRFLQVSGIEVIADGGRPPGARIISITVAGAPLEETRVYKVAATDYLVNGGDDYVTLREAKDLLPAEDSPLLSTAVIGYITSIGTVDPRGGRIIMK
jgi:2',3'-cyclic-nucleotide 2'-phosphodiesterase (5'-nucleotidase family)